MDFFRSFQKAVGLGLGSPTPPEAAQQVLLSPRSEVKAPENVPDDGSFGSILWSFLSSKLGSDVLRAGISLPSYMYEPLSILQRQAEMIEHANILNEAAKCVDNIEQLAYVCAFAVSGYSSTQRYKPNFNPLLGETFEYVDKRSNTKFLVEQVSHHPPISAFHSENDQWKFWQNSSPTTKFLGNSLDLNTHGNSYISFHGSQNQFFYTNPSTRIQNIIFGTMRMEHYGELNIRNLNGSASAIITFTRSGYFQGTQYQVEGFIYDKNKNKCVKLEGRWDSHLNATWLVDTDCVSTGQKKFLWKHEVEPIIVEEYQFRPYTVSLNEYDDKSDSLLPPTDSRRRLDRYFLEKGNSDAASNWKRTMEERQRTDKSVRNTKWNPVWFKQSEESENGLWIYCGDYWEQRARKLVLLNEGKDTEGLLNPSSIQGLACDFLNYDTKASPKQQNTNSKNHSSINQNNPENNSTHCSEILMQKQLHEDIVVPEKPSDSFSSLSEVEALTMV